MVTLLKRSFYSLGALMILGAFCFLSAKNSVSPERCSYVASAPSFQHVQRVSFSKEDSSVQAYDFDKSFEEEEEEFDDSQSSFLAYVGAGVCGICFLGATVALFMIPGDAS